MVKNAPSLPPFVAALALLLLLGLLPTPASANGSLHQSRRKLEEIQRRIRKTSKNLQEKAASEKSLSADLKTVEKELARIRGRISRASARTKDLARRIESKEKEIEHLRTSMADRKSKVRLRLVALYKGGETGLLQVLFSTSSPAQMAENYDFLGRIVRRDRELLASYRQQLESLKASTTQLTKLKHKQQTALAALGEDRRTLGQAAHLKKVLLARVRRDRETLSSRLCRLQEKARHLQALVKKLESERPREYTARTGNFSSQKGHLPWPVRGPVKVGFGTCRHPKLGTLYESQGIEIGVPPDRPIAAVWDGRVIFAKRFQGYGKLIIVDHGDSYYTLYAQASKLVKKVGDRVKKGETLAFSGFAGAGSVYFEIRHRGTPLDPTAWLAAR